MATIREDFVVEAPASAVWEALRAFDAVHLRLARGFVVACVPEPGARTVTFANGMVAREVLVGAEDAAKRLVYSVSSDRMTHHQATAEVVAIDEARARFVWTTDVLPDSMAGTIAPMMAAGARAMKATLEKDAAESESVADSESGAESVA